MMRMPVHLFFQLFHRPLNDPVFSVGLRPQFILFFRDAKEHDTQDPQGFSLLHLFDQEIDRELKMSGHGGNGLS